MVLARADAGVVPGDRTIPPTFDEVAYRDASDNRSLTTGIAGTCVAILTFALFFLYPQRAGINPILFQATLFDIIGALFLISLASMNFWFVMESIRSNPTRTRWYFRQAELCFSVGYVLLLLMPALILLTVQLYFAALLALALWVAMLLSLRRGWRLARVPLIATVPAPKVSGSPESLQ